MVVDAPMVRVRTQPAGRIGPEERLVVIRPVGESRVASALTVAGPEVLRAELVRVRSQRHRIEEVFGRATARPGSTMTRCGAGSVGIIQ